jgi:transposase
MTTVTKRKYTQEQKQEAVRLSSEPGRSVGEVAKELGIGVSSLTKWRSHYGAIHKKWETLSAEQQEIKRLQKDLAKSQEELSFLKKAVTFFASQKS